MSYELKQWLNIHKFGRFAAKLHQFSDSQFIPRELFRGSIPSRTFLIDIHSTTSISMGIESMADLKLLVTEEMMEDLCGKQHVGMTIIYRRKFMKRVSELNADRIRNYKRNRQRHPTKHEDQRPSFESFILNAIDGPSANSRMFGGEGQAVEALSARIQDATTSIRTTKRVQSEMEDNVKRAKESVEKDFDELIRVLAMRKKQMLRAIDLRHSINKELLDAQYSNILESAKVLLMTQQLLSPQIRESEFDAERNEDVMQQVEVCFEECDKYTPADYHYVTSTDFQYQAGDSNLLQKYGALRFNGEQLV